MRWCKGRLEAEAWQILVLVSMTLFIVLNYGFDSFILSHRRDAHPRGRVADVRGSGAWCCLDGTEPPIQRAS